MVMKEIEERSVPELETEEDMEAMDLVAMAEQAEEAGDMKQAQVLYRKVIRLSPKVAEFVGL